MTIKHAVKLIVAATLSALTFACGCSGGRGENNSGENLRTVTGIVRDSSFAPVKADVYYEGGKVGASGEDGKFAVDVPFVEDAALTAKLHIEGYSFTYSTYSSEGAYLNIVRADKEFLPDDYYLLSGKIVWHFGDGEDIISGETVAKGTHLMVDGNVIERDEDDRNFDVGIVKRDSIISVSKEGCSSVDISMIPYNNVCLKDALDGVTAVDSVIVSGQSVELKHIGGVTFRMLKDK